MFQGHDGTGLNADVWINGVNCMHVHDGAYGGEFEYQENTFNNPKAAQVKANIKLLDDYIATLPEVESDMGGHKFKFKMNRDFYIDKVLEEQETAKAKVKQEKKMNALYTHALVIGKPNENKYRFMDMKRPLSEVPALLLQSYLAKLRRECETTGEQILNTNLAKLGITV